MASDLNCLNGYGCSRSLQMCYSVESYAYRSTLSDHFHKNYFFNLLKSTCMQINRFQGQS